jgi:hypothetical protein
MKAREKRRGKEQQTKKKCDHDLNFTKNGKFRQKEATHFTTN